MEENNAALKQVLEAYPEQFSYFCSIDPNDADRLRVLEECLKNGAIGVKLYNGYTYAHELSIDDAKLSDFIRLPIGRFMLPAPATTNRNYATSSL